MIGIIVSAEIVAAIYIFMILAAILHQYRRSLNKRGITFIWFVATVETGLICDTLSYLLEGSTAVTALILFNGAVALDDKIIWATPFFNAIKPGLLV
ncbi:MAG: hypothetical protein K6E49_09670 [Lachnospiraceae bacterium]|nr:hypothetical protein [Lachnospiraceae bacterium]